MNHVKIIRARREGAVAKCMAEIMQELFSLTGSVSERDLTNEGFTSLEIETHGKKAREICEKRSTRDIAASGRKRQRAA